MAGKPTVKDRVREIARQSAAVKEAAFRDNLTAIAAAVRKITSALKRRRKLILFGNGGSAADSQHIAAEFVGRFRRNRKALPAVALTTDTSALTAIANDYGFESVFSRQLEAIGQKGDVALAISTSGNSPNVLKAVKTARRIGLTVIALTGQGGGALADMADLLIAVPSRHTARIQESHIAIAHCLCEIVEDALAG